MSLQRPKHVPPTPKNPTSYQGATVIRTNLSGVIAPLDGSWNSNPFSSQVIGLIGVPFLLPFFLPEDMTHPKWWLAPSSRSRAAPQTRLVCLTGGSTRSSNTSTRSSQTPRHLTLTSTISSYARKHQTDLTKLLCHSNANMTSSSLSSPSLPQTGIHGAKVWSLHAGVRIVRRHGRLQVRGLQGRESFHSRC